MSHTQKRILWTAVGAMVLLLVALLVMRVIRTAKTNSAQTKNNAATSSAAINKIDAPAGEVTSGFPKELILDPSAKTSASYTIQYTAGNQYTANLKTTKSVADEYKLYADYFAANKYTVVSKNQTTNLSSIYATKGGAEVNVTISKFDYQGPQTVVIISYLKK